MVWCGSAGMQVTPEQLQGPPQPYCKTKRTLATLLFQTGTFASLKLNFMIFGRN
jgi:hypothetical protein